MPTVFQTDSPPSSPRSPPRKRTKFSLKLKNKKKSQSEIENREKLCPIFSPSTAQNTNDDDVLEPLIPPPFAGLKNLGNICYANAVLQVLRFCPGLMQSVMEIDSLVRKLYPSKSADDEQVICYFVSELGYKISSQGREIDTQLVESRCKERTSIGVLKGLTILCFGQMK